MKGPYLDRLAARSAVVESVLCLGLDPDPQALPAGFPPNLRGMEGFARLVLAAALPFSAAVKPNLAFFEAFGSAGLRSLERLRGLIPGDVPVIADAKRGDIGATSVRHAAAIFDHLGADAVTASPFLGGSALEPLLGRVDRFVYVLCRTSNEGASEIQDLAVGPDPAASWPAEPLHRRVARIAGNWGRQWGTVGLVVGATAPAELAGIRAIVPGLPFLVPGVGAQGGDVGPVLEHGPTATGPSSNHAGHGLLVNVTRGIARAGLEGGDLEASIAAAAAEWAGRLPVLR